MILVLDYSPAIDKGTLMSYGSPVARAPGVRSTWLLEKKMGNSTGSHLIVIDVEDDQVEELRRRIEELRKDYAGEWTMNDLSVFQMV